MSRDPRKWQPPADRQRFSDAGAHVVYEGLKALDAATRLEVLAKAQLALFVDDVSRPSSDETRRVRALVALHEAHAARGRSPSLREYRKLHAKEGKRRGWPADTTLRRWLGVQTWNEALRAAHLEAVPDGDVIVFQHGPFYTAEEAETALRECDRDLRHVPTYPEYMAWAHRPDVAERPGRRPKSIHPFDRLFGGYVNALRAAGVIPGDPEHAVLSHAGIRRAEYRISDESLKAGLVEVHERLSRSPRVAEYIRERGLIYQETLAEGHPRTIASYGTLNRRFGSDWDSILVWAGLESLGGRHTTSHLRPKRGKGPRITKDTIREAMREAYDAEGEPFTVEAYGLWREERIEGLPRWERSRYPSYHTIWSRYGTWEAACGDALRPD
jgi:hypothetical protein